MDVKQIENSLFFEEIGRQLSAGKQVRICAKGNSMLPLIRNGKDEIVIAPLSEESIRPGNLVLAHVNDGRYILHRIEQVEGCRITLRGDGNVYGREQCTADRIMGEAIQVIRGRRHIHKGDALWQYAHRWWPAHPLLRRIILGIRRRIIK